MAVETRSDARRTDDGFTLTEALITTELGLVVAIPALLLHAVLQRWVKSYYSQLETDAIKFSQIETEPKAQGAQS